MNGKPKFYKIVAENRKARFDYHIEELFEAGIMLTGSEVKSLRAGKASITEAHADISGNEIVLYNSYIPEYLQANRFNHSPRRVRKLLLHKREIRKLLGKVKIKGYTLVILSVYFNEFNKAKASLALAKGKSQHDKRQTEKERDWNREKSRVLKKDV